MSFKYGFFICFIKIQSAAFTSIQEFTKIENLFTKPHNSFFLTELNKVISISSFLPLFQFTPQEAFLAFPKRFSNFLLLKFQNLS
jgi:hypothetical protein